MAIPLIWPKKTFFYPIGNTPPICFTQDLSPEQSAEVLLLGCGDPRSILYTICHDLAPDYRKLDVTCCDWEPAILARNILLLTMAADGISPALAWSIFYHFFLDEPEYDALLLQCQKLIQASTDWTTWKASKYGAYIRFCTAHTLSEARRHWALYLASNALPTRDKQAIRASFTSGMQEVRAEYSASFITCLRSAGPLFASFADQASQSYIAYWTTGTTRFESRQASLAALLSHTNPTFVYSLSGNKFNVHYATDPLAAFHLAPVFVRINDGHCGRADAAPSPPKPTLHDIITTAKEQFNCWCAALNKRTASEATNLTIRFHAGEAIAFAHALYACQRKGAFGTQAGIYTMPWGGLQIALDRSEYSCGGRPSSAPVVFNVVNVLTATVPLLQQMPWAVLHTNTLASRNADLGTSLQELGDIPTLSLLLGVAPAFYRSHFTTQSNKHDVGISLLQYGQSHNLIAWKVLSGSDNDDPAVASQQPIRPTWQAKDVARFLFVVYSNMFENEDRSVAPTLASLLTHSSLRCYTRESLVEFFALVKGRLEVDWDEVMHLFLNFPALDSPFAVGWNQYQDLNCHLYLRGVYVMESMKPENLERLRVRGASCLFRGWRDIPPVVCVVLTVPRRRLRVLEDMDPNVILTPFLQCETHSIGFHNIHASIRPIFGETVLGAPTADGEPSVIINEDPRGWDGDSDLIVTFYMPSWILLTHPPESVEVGLFVKCTLQAMYMLVPKLGLFLAVYTTNASNSANVRLVRHRPGKDGKEVEGKGRQQQAQAQAPCPDSRTACETQKTIAVNFSASEIKVSTLAVRDNISDSVVKTNLLQGASVVTQAIADNVIRVTIRDYETHFVYPFPILTNQIKVRIACKSSYVEIEAPVRSNFNDPRNLSLSLFPAARDAKAINLLNIHYLNLDTLPALKLPPRNPIDLHWMHVHLRLSFSAGEIESEKLREQKERAMLYNLKLTLNSIFNNHTQRDTRSLVVGLCNPDITVGLYTLIFVNDIRLDLSAQTIVADACVVPLFKTMPREMSKALAQLSLIAFKTLEDETFAWKRLLPAFAERCRTWKHSANCEYLTEGFPSTFDDQASFLCSCGKGKNLGSFGSSTVKNWRIFQPEATRIAIGPLFAFSSMDEMVESLKRDISPGARRTPSPDLSPAFKNCAGWDKPGALYTCSRCKAAKYCSSSCQKSHWKTHKLLCIRKS